MKENTLFQQSVLENDYKDSTCELAKLFMFGQLGNFFFLTSD